MLRRQPVVTLVGVVYFGGLCFFALGPRASLESAPLASVLIFVPAGVILMLLFSRRHWFAAFTVGVLGIVWLELACVVWRPDAPIRTSDLLAGVAGLVGGLLVGALLERLRGRRAQPPVLSFTRLSQTGSSGLTPESPRD
jgi:hypothetical protein